MAGQPVGFDQMRLREHLPLDELQAARTSLNLRIKAVLSNENRLFEPLGGLETASPVATDQIAMPGPQARLLQQTHLPVVQQIVLILIPSSRLQGRQPIDNDSADQAHAPWLVRRLHCYKDCQNTFICGWACGILVPRGPSSKKLCAS